MISSSTPRLGSTAKACTEVSTPERTRKAPSIEKVKAPSARNDRPAGQGAALLGDDRRVQQGRGHQPGHEAGVLHRVPEPPAAPAQLVVGPEGAQRDADGEQAPGGQRPGPHPARPGGVDAALDQGGHGQREHHRHADVAGVEERRVDRQRRVLQQRIERAALHRRRRPAAAAGWRRRPCSRGRARPGRPGRPPPAPSGPAAGRGRSASDRAVAGQGQAPEQHRALVAAPGAGDLVDQRLFGVRVRRHVGDREVGGDEGVDQGRRRPMATPRRRPAPRPRRPPASTALRAARGRRPTGPPGRGERQRPGSGRRRRARRS